MTTTVFRVATYFLQVRKTTQAALLVLMEQGLLDNGNYWNAK